jgi:carbonic anhydrase
MQGFDDDEFRATLTAETGRAPNWDVPGFTDLHDTMRASIETIRACDWLPHREDVRGFIFDVGTAKIEEVL